MPLPRPRGGFPVVCRVAPDDMSNTWERKMTAHHHDSIGRDAVYDVVPSLSIGQIYKTADWYDKTLKFHLGVESSLLSGLRIISPYPSTSSPLMIAR